MRVVLYILLITCVDWNYDNKQEKGTSSSTKSIPKDFKKYCKAEYKFHGKIPNHHLNKLIVVFRHGDRAPLSNFSQEWSKQKCVACRYNQKTISDCNNTQCKTGLLTTTGFKQAQTLGGFIKKNYEQLLFPDKLNRERISYRVTKIDRTHSTLFGVMKGFNKSTFLKNVKLNVNEDSLLKKKNCEYLEKLHSDGLNISEDTISLLEDNNINTGRDLSFMADEIRCAMCHNMKVDINNTENIITKILKLSNNNWSRQMNNVNKDRTAKQIVFGKFANELIQEINKDSLLSLISAHDGSLGMILSTLTSKIQTWPPYAAAIFIEIWCKGGREFVRLVYNKEKIVIDGFDDDLIPIEKFMRFIENLRKQESEINQLCNTTKQTRHNLNLIDNRDTILKQYYFQYF